MVKNLPANAADVRDVGLIPGSGRSPRGGHGNPLQYSCFTESHGQRSLMGYHPRGNWLQLLSNGNQSTYNCQLLKGIVIDPNSIHCNQDRDFPSGSVGKETTCNAGDPDWEDPLERGMATHSSILARKIPMDRGAWQATIHRVTKSRT